MNFIEVLGEMIENTADPSLLVFLFSSNSFYTGLSCTILLLFFHIHSLITSIYTVGKETGRREGEKGACEGLFSPVPLKCFNTYFTC